MDDHTREPFRCSAEACRTNQENPSFETAERFCLHWSFAHSPRCPRTDCKFSLKDLGQTTPSYFFRHWTTHFPELKAGKSTCDKCQRLFANASNRDRHATKCKGDNPGTDRVVIGSIDPEHGQEPAGDMFELAAPDDDFFERSGVIGDPQPFNFSPFDGEMSFLNDFSFPSVCEVVPSTMTAAASSMSASHVTASITDFSSGRTSLGHAYASSMLQNTSFPNMQGSRVIELEEGPADQYSGACMDQMFDTHVSEPITRIDDLPSNPRKRLCEEVISQMPKRQHPTLSDTGLHCDSSKHSEADVGAFAPGATTYNAYQTFGPRATVAGPVEQDSSAILEPAVSLAQDRTLGILQASDGSYSLIPRGAAMSLPLRTRKQYKEKSWRLAETHSSSRHVHKYMQLFAVKSFIPNATGCKEVSYDHYIWVHKIVHSDRGIVDTTSVLVNNILVSKKTRFPKIIDDDASIFQLCATGQYDEVNRLLARGEATILDVNGRGETLLHVAALHLQFEICQLLLAKGADVEAREWVHQENPLSSVCYGTLHSSSHDIETISLECRNLVDVIRLLVESGLDICFSVEVNHDLYWIAGAFYHWRYEKPKAKKFIGAFSWLFRNYMDAITCDGILPSEHLHEEAYAAILHSGIYLDSDDTLDPKEREQYKCGLLTRKDTRAFQYFWLRQLTDRIDYPLLPGFSPEFCRTYVGGFHYRLQLDLGGQVMEVSPLELALESFAVFRAFNNMLLATGTDVKEFTKVECTMPWCTWTQQTLENLFSVDPGRCLRLTPLFSRRRFCHACSQDFQHEGVMDWQGIVELVRSGRSLDSLLEFSSDEEEDRLRLEGAYCESCLKQKSGTRAIFHSDAGSASEDSEFDTEEDNDETMAFIETEVENGSSSVGRISVAEHNRSGDGDTDSSDDDLEDEDFSDGDSSDGDWSEGVN